MVHGILRKCHNKCFVHTDRDNIMWEKYSKQYNIISRMFQQEGLQFKEVELEKDGNCGTWAVLCIKHISEILSVESKLDSNFMVDDRAYKLQGIVPLSIF